MEEVTIFPDVACDVCGIPASSYTRLTMNGSKGGTELTVRCDLCEGLIESGLVRPEAAEDGSTVYRQWRPVWTPGPLVEKR